MGLCRGGHHPVLSEDENPKRLGLKRPFALPCLRSPGLVPRSHLSYLLMDSLLSTPMGAKPLDGFAESSFDGNLRRVV